MMYLSWFFRGLPYNPSAITEADINEYVSHYSAPGGMRAGFEYYRAFPQDAIQIQNYSKTKLTMPVLAMGAGYIPALGGKNPYAKYRIWDEAISSKCYWYYCSKFWTFYSRRATTICNRSTLKIFRW